MITDTTTVPVFKFDYTIDQLAELTRLMAWNNFEISKVLPYLLDIFPKVTLRDHSARIVVGLMEKIIRVRNGERDFWVTSNGNYDQEYIVDGILKRESLG